MGVGERAVGEGGVVRVGADVRAGGQQGAVGQGDVLGALAQRAHFVTRQHVLGFARARLRALRSDSLLNLCDSRMKESSGEQSFTLAQVMGFSTKA